MRGPKEFRRDASDTIAAIATPPGTGGISIVRISGAGALAVGDKIIRLRNGRAVSRVRSWSLSLGDVTDPDTGEVVDEAVAVVMRAPRSYTGEDVLEIQCHGGRLVTEKVLELVLANGARPAGPGEFTRRAYLSGRITLEEAEAVLDLINAPSEASLREAGQRLRGELGSMVRAWEGRLYEVLAVLQGGEDFPEDVSDVTEKAMEDLRSLHGEIQAVLSRAPLGMALVSGIEVCLVGRPNAGKSSIFNALLGQERAIVTDVPGTTRDVLRERTLWGGLPVVLLDTAGLRQTHEIVEAIGVEKAESAASEAEVILYVVDDTVGLSPEDREWISRWRGRKLLVLVNKCDLGVGRVSADDIREFLGADWLRVSGVTGQGVERIKERVCSWFAEGGLPESALPGPARQVDCLRRASEAIGTALRDRQGGWTEDVMVMSLEEAAKTLSEISGKNVPEEVLDQVFSKFCVGK